MIFHRADPSSHYRSLRLVSENGLWELGMSPYHHGVRMRMGRNGKPPQLLDFCMGHHGKLYSPILLAILKILEPVAEDQTEEAIDALFPWHGKRPELSLHLPKLLEVSRVFPKER